MVNNIEYYLTFLTQNGLLYFLSFYTFVILFYSINYSIFETCKFIQPAKLSFRLWRSIISEFQCYFFFLFLNNSGK